MFHQTIIKRYFPMCYFFIILLCSCSKPYDYTEDGAFITATVSPAGPDDYRNLITRHVAIYQDGTLILSADEDNQTAKPTLKAQIDKKDIDYLKELIEEVKFRKLKNDVSTPSEDGARYQVTVNFTNGSKKVKGWNPINEQFNTIHEHVFSLIDDDDYAKWRTEIEEHIWEHHSLRKNRKDEYQTDGPFFTLMMENRIPIGLGNYQYYTHISLDLDGKILLSAEDNENKKITNIRTIEKQLTDKELEHFQSIILENFWKLNENQRNSDHNLMETMTVYMTEEEKKIEGEEPDHPRYVKIKESIIDFMDKDEYEKWQNELETFLLNEMSHNN